MTYEQFKMTVFERLKTDISNPKSIDIRQVLRNNGQTLDALSIMEKGINVTPAIYLDPLFHTYESGIAFDDIYQDILKIYLDNKVKERIDPVFFTDYELVKERIAYRVINRDKNQALLSDTPHQVYLDLAVVFYVLVNINREHGMASILIRNEHLKLWGITEKELGEAARINTPRLLPVRFRNIRQILSEFQADPFFQDELNELNGLADAKEDVMYILENEHSYYGAASILYPDIQEFCAERFGSGYFILPSSVHELILVPSKNSERMHEMSEMVAEVNAACVMPEEVLADHAYYYSTETRQIEL